MNAASGNKVEPMLFIGETAAVACSVASSAAIALFTNISGKIGVYRSMLLRFFFAMIFIGLIHYLVTGVFLEPYESRERLYYIIVSGLIGFAIGDLFLFRSSVLLGPRLGTLVFISYVPMTTLIAIPLLNEQLGNMALLGMAVTLAGIVLVVMAKRDHDPKYFVPQKLMLGIVLGLMGALCQSVALVLAKMGMQGSVTSTANALFVRLLAAFAGSLVIGFFSGWTKGFLKSASDKKIVLWTALGTFVGPLLSVWLSLIAVRYAYTGVATTLMALTPITVIPIAQITHKEKITLQMVIGTLIAVAGVAMLFLL